VIVFALILILQIACVVHCVRHGRSGLWILGIIFFPLIGSAAYVIVEVLPGRARRDMRIAGQAAVRRIDPEREVRAARDALDTADTAANRIALGDALAGQEKWSDAVLHYREALFKVPLADRPTQLKLARALLESGNAAEALRLVETLPATQSAAETDRAALLQARALAETGERDQAIAILADIGTRMPGGEAQCRQAALLIEAGRDAEAVVPLAEAERRARTLDRYEKVRDRDMYAWAARTLADLRIRGF